MKQPSEDLFYIEEAVPGLTYWWRIWQVRRSDKWECVHTKDIRKGDRFRILTKRLSGDDDGTSPPTIDKMKPAVFASGARAVIAGSDAFETEDGFCVDSEPLA